MAVIDNFDSYSTGDLNGQGGWSTTSAQIDVTTAVAQSGANSITRTSTGGLNPCTKTITSLTTQEIEVSFYVRSTVTNDAGGGSFGLAIRDGTSEICRAVMSQDNNDIRIVGATTVSIMSGASTDTWYKVTIQVDFTNDRCRAKIDGGSYSSYVSGLSGAFDSVDSLNLVFGGTSGSVFIDTIESAEPGASGGLVTRKSLMGVGI